MLAMLASSSILQAVFTLQLASCAFYMRFFLVCYVRTVCNLAWLVTVADLLFCQKLVSSAC